MVLCLERMQYSDSGSATLCSKTGSLSQQNLTFSELGGCATEQLSSNSICSSLEDDSCDGIKLEETEAWNLRLAYSTIWPGMVLAVCPYLDRYFLASSGSSVSRKILHSATGNFGEDCWGSSKECFFVTVLCLQFSK